MTLQAGPRGTARPHAPTKQASQGHPRTQQVRPGQTAGHDVSPRHTQAFQ